MHAATRLRSRQLAAAHLIIMGAHGVRCMRSAPHRRHCVGQIVDTKIKHEMNSRKIFSKITYVTTKQQNRTPADSRTQQN